jgi:hypothetical protein
MGPSQKDDVVMTLCRHPGLEFLLDHRVLTIDGELVPQRQFTKRKLQKVTDLRGVHEQRRPLFRPLR